LSPRLAEKEPRAAPAVIAVAGNEAAAMANHWRHDTPRADEMRGLGDGYLTGWIASIVGTLGAIMLVAHFGV